MTRALDLSSLYLGCTKIVTEQELLSIIASLYSRKRMIIETKLEYGVAFKIQKALVFCSHSSRLAWQRRLQLPKQQRASRAAVVGAAALRLNFSYHCSTLLRLTAESVLTPSCLSIRFKISFHPTVTAESQLHLPENLSLLLSSGLSSSEPSDSCRPRQPDMDHKFMLQRVSR
jgi:hypothetical protein